MGVNDGKELLDRRKQIVLRAICEQRPVDRGRSFASGFPEDVADALVGGGQRTCLWEPDECSYRVQPRNHVVDEFWPPVDYSSDLVGIEPELPKVAS